MHTRFLPNLIPAFVGYPRMNRPCKAWAFDDVLQTVPAELVVINKDYIVFTDKIKSGLVVYQTGTSKNPLNGPRQTLYTI